MLNFIFVFIVVLGEIIGICLVGLVREIWEIIFIMYSCLEIRLLDILYVFFDLFSWFDVCFVVFNICYIILYLEISLELVFGGF